MTPTYTLTAYTFDWYGWLEAGERIISVRLHYRNKLKRVSGTDIGVAHVSVWIRGEPEKINGLITCSIGSSKLRHAERSILIEKGQVK